MLLTHDEFLEYIKKNGITKAKTTEEFKEIPIGTELWFSYCEDYISTFPFYTNDKNKEYNYPFDYQWEGFWRDEYKGLFEVEDKPEFITVIDNTPEQIPEKIPTDDDIILRLLTEFPDKSPKDVECFLEILDDYDLLSEKGDKLRLKLINKLYE